MFLGIRSKHKKDPSVRVTYTIHIMEIRPWPPSDSLRSLQTVLLQWESGNHHSGTFLSTAVDSKIVFNESFKLPLVLHQDKKDQDKFHRNNLDFTLFSPHNNKSRGQLLATAVLNLADYGVIEHVVSLGALVNFKKGVGSSYNSIQPVLIVLVEPVEMGSCSLSKELEPSLDGLGMAYFTDDDDDVDSPNYEAEPSSLSSRIHKIYERSMTSIKKKPDNPYVRSYSLSSRHQPDTFAALSEEVIWNRSHEVISDSKHIVTENPQQAIENKAPVDIKEAISEPSENEVEWERRIEMLEEELRETAAIEIGLYSVVAEHASSVNKVHVAARRLSRFYSDACKSGSKAKRASAARATVCGLVVVSKSCGNDVARLTFWLSNSIMLRTTVIQIASESSNEFDDVSTFITALENIESWLFSRIIESVWWQTFTPHMHPAVTEEIDVAPVLSTKKTYSRSNSLIYHGQGIFSTELWKKAFKDACESLCPIRADGHECGCLILLVRMLMVQLVDRLDTAMFNAILRESAEEMPTDPLSDPITESKVLPILAGKSSFGAGVELKNSIGTWSRCLTDIFGLEDETRENTKVFRLLHALSDLMMLPFEMLADVSTIREVCPMLGPSVVKRILSTYVPDEFCPDSIPQSLIEALDNEEVSVIGEESGVVVSFPCAASPARYSPPCAALVGDVGSEMVQRSSLLKKSYTSDDELDELDSPFTSIIPESFRSPALAKLSSAAREEGGKRVVRYQLLREIWRDDE